MEYIKETKEIPIKGKYDVIVVGGGIGGIAAALAAARKGAKTLLLEKTYLLGGLATAGLITIYLTLCDGKGNQVSFGIAEELLRLSVKYGSEYCHDAKEWGKAWLENGTLADKKKDRFQVKFNASLFAICCEQLLLKNGVEILYGISVASAVVKQDKIQSVITESKSGRECYVGKNFIDASGDADLAVFSNAETEKFQRGNILASWYYEQVENDNKLRMIGYAEKPNEEIDSKKARFEGLTVEDLTRLTVCAHEKIKDNFLQKGKITPDHAITSIATIPQVRMTRRIVGKYTLDEGECFKVFEDSVGVISDWRKAGPIFEVPFGCLVSNRIKNLAACGRCISVTDKMWDITRVIPCCAVTGESVGVAAAMFEDFSAVEIKKLQNALIEQGVRLHVDEVLKVK